MSETDEIGLVLQTVSFTEPERPLEIWQPWIPHRQYTDLGGTFQMWFGMQELKTFDRTCKAEKLLARQTCKYFSKFLTL